MKSNVKRNENRKRDRNRGREKRNFQSQKLQDRIKRGSENSGKKFSILSPDSNLLTWRPKDGEHIIDIIPYIAGEHDPIVKEGDPTYTFEFWVHTNVGPSENSFLCPAEMYNKKCPICEDRQKIRDRGESEDIWKKLFPKRRNLYNIISFDGGEEEKGIQIWDVSWHYFEKFILAISQKPTRSRRGKPASKRIINFADPEEGKSISFTIEPAKSKNDFKKYVGHAFDDRSYEIEDKILDEAKVLDEAIIIPKYDDIYDAYFGGVKEEKPSRRKPKKSERDMKDVSDDLENIDDLDDLEDFMDENGLEVDLLDVDDFDDLDEDDLDDYKEFIGKELDNRDIPF